MSGIRQVVKTLAARAGLFGALRATEQYVHAVLGHVHEPDFRAIPRDLPPGCIVDVGANVGQSVTAFRRLFPGREIHAFEPNPACLPTLRRVARLAGRGVTVHECGLGESPAELEFHVPVLDDGVEMLQEGSFDPTVFETPVTIERIGRPFRLRTRRAPVRTLDAMDLRVAILKVDVQGLEMAVLRGATGVLRRDRPVIFLERADRADAAIAEYLAGFGYESRTLTTNVLHTPLGPGPGTRP